MLLSEKFHVDIFGDSVEALEISEAWDLEEDYAQERADLLRSEDSEDDWEDDSAEE